MIEGSIDALAVALAGEAHAVDHQQRTGRRAGVQAAEVDLGASFDIGARHWSRPGRARRWRPGRYLNRSAVVRAPVMAKSCGLKFVTGTPTAAVPRMSEPVISTVSGISSAWATISPCARAGPAFAMVMNDAVPNSVASLARIEKSEALMFIGVPPVVGERKRHAAVRRYASLAPARLPRQAEVNSSPIVIRTLIWVSRGTAWLRGSFARLKRDLFPAACEWMCGSAANCDVVCVPGKHVEADCSPRRCPPLPNGPAMTNFTRHPPATASVAAETGSQRRPERVRVFRPGVSQCRLRLRGETLSDSCPPIDRAPTAHILHLMEAMSIHYTNEIE